MTQIHSALTRWKRIPLLREILGMAGGAMVALVMYQGYHLATQMAATLIPAPSIDAVETVSQESESLPLLALADDVRVRLQDADSSEITAEKELPEPSTVSARTHADVVAAEPLHAGADTLPVSGPGLWLALCTAIGWSAWRMIAAQRRWRTAGTSV